MKPIPVIGIPILNRGDFLIRCLQSIEVEWDRLVIVNNGRDESVLDAIRTILKTYPNVIVYQPESNLGVAASWNWIIKNNPAPWHMIVGNDIQFKPNTDFTFVEYIWQHHLECPIFFGNQGHSCYAITKMAIDAVGYFDENFYPAYLEDCDHQTRLHLAGLHHVDVPGVELVHGEAPSWGSSTIYSDPGYRAANGITHTNNFEYYKAKWGGINECEVFKYPFNDPTKALSYWEVDPGLRRKNSIWKPLERK